MNPSHQFENGDFNYLPFSSIENGEIDFTSFPVGAGAVELTTDQGHTFDLESTLTSLVAWRDDSSIAMDTDDLDVTLPFSDLINHAALLSLDEPTSQSESSSEPDNSLDEVLSSITSSPVDIEATDTQLGDIISPPPQKRGRGRPRILKKPAPKTAPRVNKYELEPITKDIRNAIAARKNRVAAKRRLENLVAENDAKEEKISRLEEIIKDKNSELTDYKKKLEIIQQILTKGQNQVIIDDTNLDVDQLEATILETM
ncbi:uncharacterized protein LOC110861882 [Folsomia candida]|uniref:uncharacterized protein LOC110861882 n=1 Tax=Folsomia candida TaxID=158441 RepID=UPI000B8EE9E2|nr:uncharacterized protein LOC110861882 [Folsomia candida]